MITKIVHYYLLDNLKLRGFIKLFFSGFLNNLKQYCDMFYIVLLRDL